MMTESKDTTQELTASEAAEFLGVSHDSLERARAYGDLTGRREGRCVYFKVEDLAAYKRARIARKLRRAAVRR